MHEFTYRSVLVTGGLGFIGSHVIDVLLEKNSVKKIINIDKITYASYKPYIKECTDVRHIFIQKDILQTEEIAALLIEHQVDLILHLAAESHVDNSIADPMPFIQSNVVGTYSICQAALQAYKSGFLKKMVHISTDEVYGSLEKTDAPFVETCAYKPNSPYSASKAGSDLIVRSYIQTYGLPACITHAGNNYGPRQHTEKLIPKAIYHALNNMRIPLYGNGSNIRDWIYVRDHAQAILIAAQNGTIGEHYNIGANMEFSNISIVQKICAYLDEKLPQRTSYANLITFVEDRKGHDWRYALNTQKIQNIGFIPQTLFMNGIEKTIDFYMQKQAQLCLI